MHINEICRRVVEYENGKFGIQSRHLGSKAWLDGFPRYDTEEEARSYIDNQKVKRVCDGKSEP